MSLVILILISIIGLLIVGIVLTVIGICRECRRYEDTLEEILENPSKDKNYEN